MSIKSKKPNIREATPPGPRTKTSVRHEQPRDARGRPTRPQPTYDELHLFHLHATAALRDLRSLGLSARQLLAGGDVDGALAALERFQRPLPELGKHPEAETP